MIYIMRGRRAGQLLVLCTLGLGAAGAAGCKGDKGSASASSLPEKGPWDAVKLSYSKQTSSGGPEFIVENTGRKTVTVLFIDFYGYDAKGNQVAKKELSFNIPLKGGDKSDASTSAAAGAVTWEATYHGISFEGDPKPTMDPKRAPDKKPKGK